MRLAGDQRGGAAVAEDQEGQHLLQVVDLLQVQGAELQADHQHPRLGLGSDDVAGELQRADGRIAAHEADEGALDRRVEPAALHQLKVQARGGEAGAGGDDQVGDALQVLAQPQPLHRPLGERRGSAW